MVGGWGWWCDVIGEKVEKGTLISVNLKNPNLNFILFIAILLFSACPVCIRNLMLIVENSSS